MCTVSWIHRTGGYELFCNRDEKRTRPIALPPKLQSRAGVRFLTPVDPQSGGTWIAVNQFGISICLLNGYPTHKPSIAPTQPVTSRGLIPVQLIAAASTSECILQLQQLVLAPFAPFTLLVLQPDKPAIITTWDGRRIAVEHPTDPPLPLTSSSFESHRVSIARRQQFIVRLRRAGRVSPTLLHEFHRSHGEPHNAYSSCMHRADSETVSFSRVIVDRNRIGFLYSPGPPCRSVATQEVALGRTA
jgi:hypothetical protein